MLVLRLLVSAGIHDVCYQSIFPLVVLFTDPFADVVTEICDGKRGSVRREQRSKCNRFTFEYNGTKV